MRIFTEQPLKEYIEGHPEAKTALQEWASIVKNSSWSSFEEMKSSFADVSRMGDKEYSFSFPDKRRLVVVIQFPIQLICIKLIN